MNEEPKVSKNKEKKMAVVASLSDKFAKANAVVFTNYAGLTHQQIEALKRELKKAQSEFVVAKNSLIERSSGKKLEGEHVLHGQTGTLFAYDDIIEPLKALAKTIKELNLPNIKFGIMDGDFITGDQVSKLATLPTKDVLLTQVVFGLKSPISGLHRALNWNLQKLVMTLSAVAQAKPAATSAPEPAAEPVKEEPVAEKAETEQPEEPSEQSAATNSADEVPAELTENQETQDKGGEN
jgi:large subunit ribosomal protein L10